MKSTATMKSTLPRPPSHRLPIKKTTSGMPSKGGTGSRAKGVTDRVLIADHGDHSHGVIARIEGPRIEVVPQLAALTEIEESAAAPPAKRLRVQLPHRSQHALPPKSDHRVIVPGVTRLPRLVNQPLVNVDHARTQLLPPRRQPVVKTVPAEMTHHEAEASRHRVRSGQPEDHDQRVPNSLLHREATPKRPSPPRSLRSSNPMTVGSQTTCLIDWEPRNRLASLLLIAT